MKWDQHLHDWITLRRILFDLWFVDNRPAPGHTTLGRAARCVAARRLLFPGALRGPLKLSFTVPRVRSSGFGLASAGAVASQKAASAC